MSEAPVIASTDPEALRRRIAGTLLPGFLGTSLPDWLEERLRAGLGGVCLFGQNIASPGQVRELTAAIRDANPQAVIAIDEEGGDVTRLHYATGSPYPGNAVLGRIGDEAYTEAVARRVGHELSEAGVTLDFAPDVDINSNPGNPVIGVRSFGADPQLVAAHGVAWTRGLQSTGVAAAAKHFPGHGDTSADSHVSLPVVDAGADALRERELVPFRAVVDAGVRAVMTSHILLPQLDAVHPATFSPVIVEGLLRGDLGFDGVVVTDALDMRGASGETGIPEAAVRALSAGCDLLCLGTGNTDEQLTEIEDAIAQAVAAGRLSEERIVRAASRVEALAAADALPATGDASSASGELDSDDVSRVLRSFEISEAARRWLTGLREQFSVVRIETEANIAVGEAPWCPLAAVAADPSAPVVVIGRDNQRHPSARDTIDRLRAQNDRVLVIDMGWPDAGRAYADLATFGASRLVGRALLELLDGSGDPARNRTESDA
ncbi:beta-N-acetylhexosaminidase [Leifsonia sp. AG29]|uniref:beta-N-acetylhexosaminidase n=1 Tax=Leifsonia sp. AG29 TaxID=2598860 RepID=UPI00131AE1FF|nr:beta-N-acetylhexosaminidase [Leifsonia sp. AG29]